MQTMHAVLFGTTALVPIMGMQFAPPVKRKVGKAPELGMGYGKESVKDRKNRLARERRAAKKSA